MWLRKQSNTFISVGAGFAYIFLKFGMKHLARHYLESPGNRSSSIQLCENQHVSDSAQLGRQSRQSNLQVICVNFHQSMLQVKLKLIHGDFDIARISVNGSFLNQILNPFPARKYGFPEMQDSAQLVVAKEAEWGTSTPGESVTHNYQSIESNRGQNQRQLLINRAGGAQAPSTEAPLPERTDITMSFSHSFNRRNKRRNSRRLNTLFKEVYVDRGLLPHRRAIHNAYKGN